MQPYATFMTASSDFFPAWYTLVIRAVFFPQVDYNMVYTVLPLDIISLMNQILLANLL